MRAAIFNEPRSVTVGERRDPVIAEPTDAVVRVVLACVITALLLIAVAGRPRTAHRAHARERAIAAT